MINMNDFHREYLSIQSELQVAMNRVLESGWYVLGPEVQGFEKQFAKFVGSQYCVGVANGLEGLQIALLSLDIGPGDEVITVSSSAVATTLAITQTGARPVFVDIDEYYHLDPTALQAALTSKTKAIMPVHLYGQTANMVEILAIADKAGIHVVEDACQAHGATLNGKQAGSFGTLGCFSFYPTKNLGAVGDAGAITTNSPELYEKMLMLRNYGQRTRYYHDVLGINSRMDELQAAILQVKLKHLPALLEQRRALAKIYLTSLSDIPEITLPLIRKGAEHSFHLFVIAVPNRTELQKFLNKHGVETLIHYPVPIHKQMCYPEFHQLKLKQSEFVADHIISIPIHPFLITTEVQIISDLINNYYA